MSEPRHVTGKIGEVAAAQYLSRQGYRILERNYRCRFGEIDLIAQDGKILAFIEVKTRRSHAYGPAAESVTPQKQRHLFKASQVYLVQRNRTDDLCRFDVVTVEMDAEQPHVELIKDAFQVTGD